MFHNSYLTSFSSHSVCNTKYHYFYCSYSYWSKSQQTNHLLSQYRLYAKRHMNKQENKPRCIRLKRYIWTWEVRRRKIKNKNFKTLKNILINSSGIKKHAHHSSQVAVHTYELHFVFFFKDTTKKWVLWNWSLWVPDSWPLTTPDYLCSDFGIFHL